MPREAYFVRSCILFNPLAEVLPYYIHLVSANDARVRRVDAVDCHTLLFRMDTRPRVNIPVKHHRLSVDFIYFIRPENSGLTGSLDVDT